MKILTYIFVVLLAVGAVYVFSLLQEFSYFSLTKNYTEIGTLLLRPLDYKDKQVCTAGKYTLGDGVSELTDAKNPSGTIWIATPVEKSIFASLWNQYISNEPYKTAVVRVCGVFEVASGINDGFGNNNAYQYQIITKN